jgi:hypothetical protein
MYACQHMLPRAPPSHVGMHRRASYLQLPVRMQRAYKYPQPSITTISTPATRSPQHLSTHTASPWPQANARPHVHAPAQFPARPRTTSLLHPLMSSYLAPNNAPSSLLPPHLVSVDVLQFGKRGGLWGGLGDEGARSRTKRLLRGLVVDLVSLV